MTTDTARRDEAVNRVRRELRRLVRESDRTQRYIEERNGFTRGYLSQVLQGHMTLTVRHVLGILEALEMPPPTFFERLFGHPEPAEREVRWDEIRERMARYDAALDELEEKGLLEGDE